MDVNGLMTLEVTNAWTKYVVENILVHDNIFSEGLLFVPYEQNQDKTVYTDLEYYAITGDREAPMKTVLSFKQELTMISRVGLSLIFRNIVVRKIIYAVRFITDMLLYW